VRGVDAAITAAATPERSRNRERAGRAHELNDQPARERRDAECEVSRAFLRGEHAAAHGIATLAKIAAEIQTAECVSP